MTAVVSVAFLAAAALHRSADAALAFLTCPAVGIARAPAVLLAIADVLSARGIAGAVSAGRTAITGAATASLPAGRLAAPVAAHILTAVVSVAFLAAAALHRAA